MAATDIHRGAALTLREGRAPVRERLIAMVFLMALLHALVILGLTFSASSRPKNDDTPQLDVLLVTDQVPEVSDNSHAAYLAQRSQLGAGTSDAPIAARSPESRGAPPALDSGNGEDARNAQSSSQPVLSSSAASQDIRYVGTAQSQSSAAPELPQLLGATDGPPLSGVGDAMELELAGRANAGHWVSPDTQASKLAPYLAAWKSKVERVGTLNFPSAARSAGLSGSPVLEVEIAANGRLTRARVRRSSGFGALDQAALSILRLASPFDPFPPALAADYSHLRFAYQWDFVSGTLQNGAVTPSADAPAGP